MNDKFFSIKKFGILLFLSIICVVGLFLFIHKKEKINHHAMVIIEDLYVTVDIADTEISRHRGLGGQRDLCDHCGMLFLFDESKKRSFWMKDMFFDIDIIWIQDDHIVGIERAVPYKGKEKEVVVSPHLVNKVLEMPAGTVDRHAIYIGQKVKYVDTVF